FLSPVILHLFAPFFLSCSCPPRDLHSFPTRRSSDLAARRGQRHFDMHAPCLRIVVVETAFVDQAEIEQVDRNFRIVHRSQLLDEDRKSTRLNSSHVSISYAVFCLKKKKHIHHYPRLT